MKRTFYYDPQKNHALRDFTNRFQTIVEQTKKDSQTMVLICIGTDRATGDCLGPFVGHYLMQLLSSPLPIIFGNLMHPVHAANLQDTLDYIYASISFPYVIVVDACLGNPKHVGYVTLSQNALYPGRGVHKKLPPIGQISITGIVDQFGGNNFQAIQNTRLHHVMQLASFIASGISKGLEI